MVILFQHIPKGICYRLPFYTIGAIAILIVDGEKSRGLRDRDRLYRC
jgi:hypothetical protein